MTEMSEEMTANPTADDKSNFEDTNSDIFVNGSDTSEEFAEARFYSDRHSVSSEDSRFGYSKSKKVTKAMSEEELQDLRLKINSRERRRMHDLNSALDGLREVMPYAHGPSVRKLSKIATLLLAKNYILMLNSSLEEMKKLVSDIYQTNPAALRAPPAHAHHGIRHVPPHISPIPTPHHLSSISPSGVNPLHSRDLEALHTPSSKESPQPALPAFVSPHDRHLMGHRLSVPCSCNHCVYDSLRLYGHQHSISSKYHGPMPSSQPYRK